MVRSVVVRPNGQDLAMLSGWVSAGRLRPVVGRRLPLTHIARAHHDSTTRTSPSGKTVLIVDEQLADLTPQPSTDARR